MSSAELSKRIGVRTENIRNWENGGTPRDRVMIDEMARALNVSTDYLFGVKDAPHIYDGPFELARIIAS
jgi:transcriptional regulator with XRE-family HTH domain